MFSAQWVGASGAVEASRAGGAVGAAGGLLWTFLPVFVFSIGPFVFSWREGRFSEKNRTRNKNYYFITHLDPDK